MKIFVIQPKQSLELVIHFIPFSVPFCSTTSFLFFHSAHKSLHCHLRRWLLLLLTLPKSLFKWWEVTIICLNAFGHDSIHTLRHENCTWCVCVCVCTVSYQENEAAKSVCVCVCIIYKSKPFTLLICNSNSIAVSGQKHTHTQNICKNIIQVCFAWLFPPKLIRKIRKFYRNGIISYVHSFASKFMWWYNKCQFRIQAAKLVCWYGAANAQWNVLLSSVIVHILSFCALISHLS